MNIIALLRTNLVLCFVVFFSLTSVAQFESQVVTTQSIQIQMQIQERAYQECLNDYNALKLAGVRLASRGTTGLRCVSNGVLACPNQTRIDTNDRHFGNAGGWFHFIGSRAVYCISESVLTPYPGFKRDICENDANSGRSEFKDGFGQNLEFAWVGTNSDGACHCRPKGSTTNFAQSPDCTLQNPFGGVPATLAAGGRDLSLPIETSGGNTGDTETMPGRIIEFPNGGEAAMSRNAALLRPQAASPAPPPTAPVESPQMVTCADTAFTTLSERCENNANSAETECRNPELGEGAAAARNAATVGQRVNVTANQGSGMKQQCLNGALVATTTSESIEQIYGNCRAMANSCRSLCNVDTMIVEMETRCSANVGSDANSGLNREYLTNKKLELKSRVADSVARCGAAASAERQLSQLLTESGQVLTSAARCACQTSSTTTNCNVMPTAAQCGQNSSLPGCEFYGQIAVCAPNTSTYNEDLCRCTRNPNSAGCGSTTGLAAVSNSAVNVTNTQGGPSSFGGAATGASVGASTGTGAAGATAANPVARTTGSGGIDLSSTNGSQDSQQANLNDGSGNSASSARGENNSSFGGAVSGGGNGNATASVDDGTAAELAKTEKGLFGGMFNQLKNSVLSRVGLNNESASNGNYLNGSKNGMADEFDAKKFRPKRLRGVASDGDDFGLGLKNMDIWKMMNRCTRGESCKSNINGFIVDP